VLAQLLLAHCWLLLLLARSAGTAAAGTAVPGLVFATLHWGLGAARQVLARLLRVVVLLAAARLVFAAGVQPLQAAAAAASVAPWG